MQVDLLEEGQHVAAGVAPPGLVQDFSGGDVERREQVQGAAASVVMGHRAGSGRHHPPMRLNPRLGKTLQRLPIPSRHLQNLCHATTLHHHII